MRCVSSCPSESSMVWFCLLLCRLRRFLFVCLPTRCSQINFNADLSHNTEPSKIETKKKKGWGSTNTSENVKTLGFKPQRKLLPKLPWSSIVLVYDCMKVWKWLIKTKWIDVVHRQDSVVIGKNFLFKRNTSLNKTEQNRWSVTNARLMGLWERPVVIILFSSWHFLTLQIQAACFPRCFPQSFFPCVFYLWWKAIL